MRPRKIPWGSPVDSPRNSLVLAVVAAAASACLLWFGTGMHPLWWMAWIAPIPVLLAAPRVTGAMAALAAFAAWAIGDLNQWHYLYGVLRIPLGPVLMIVLFPALVFTIDVLAYRSVLLRSVWRAALVFPSIWVFYEFASESFSPHGTAGNLSYSQMNFLPVLQLVSVTGIWGISFCLFLFAATLSALLSRHGNPGEKRILAISVAAVLVAVLGFGAWRLYTGPPDNNAVKVGLVASDLDGNILAEKHDDMLRLLRDYAAEARRLAAQGAQAVVTPEKIAVVRNSDVPEVDSLLGSTAAQTGAMIVVGVIHPTPAAKWNEARLYEPNGTIHVYEKHHMLPPFESSFAVGTERTEWQEPSGLWGMTICKDMDFPALSRQYGSDGAGLLLVPAWDFDVDGWQHGRWAILRGVESGFSIARAPKEGIITVTDDRGRVLAERATSSAPFASLVATAPVHHDATVYASFGDWFAWLNIVLLAALIAAAIVMGRRGQH